MVTVGVQAATGSRPGWVQMVCEMAANTAE